MTSQTVLQPGAEAPDFRLRGPGGVFYSLSEFRGEKNVMIVFFPLAFSPVCSHQLPDIEKVVRRLEALDAVVLGVSVDSYYANEAFARSLGLSFPLLSDFDRSVSRAWGILIPERNYSGRALFLVDKQGRLAYGDVSPTPAEIPSNEALIAALERLR